jgi:hypothetical protein
MSGVGDELPVARMIDGFDTDDNPHQLGVMLAVGPERHLGRARDVERTEHCRFGNTGACGVVDGIHKHGKTLEPYQSTRLKPIQCWPLSLGGDMRRREFISLLGGAAEWPLGARAQERVRRVGVLSNPGPDDAEMRLAPRRLYRRCKSWAGPLAGTCKSTTAGVTAMPIVFAPMRQN